GINILDIGSGRGGDISKWKRLIDKQSPEPTGRVVAVEPNPDNFKEFKSRLEKNKEMKDRVVLVETGGEDTVEITRAVQDFIPQGKVDVVFLMLSMSF